MINPSVLLRRAIQADAIFSGASALLLTFGAGALAPMLNLPEALLRETGLFLIAYAALVGWLGSRQSMPKALVLIVIAGNCDGRLRRTAIYRAAQERRRARGLSKTSVGIVIASEAKQSIAAYNDFWIASSLCSSQ
jgi:hypothetical protein